MTSSNRLSYITGPDGIRAVAVMAVLFYHANSPWALGGFLGVETFFVLSGFLITSLLLVEWGINRRDQSQNRLTARCPKVVAGGLAIVTTSHLKNVTLSTLPTKFCRLW
jgi:peptidoglycan/LPS O-acetylase OafA/YrhL